MVCHEHVLAVVRLHVFEAVQQCEHAALQCLHNKICSRDASLRVSLFHLYLNMCLRNVPELKVE